MQAESFFELLFFPPPPRVVMTETEMGIPEPVLAMVSATDISVGERFRLQISPFSCLTEIHVFVEIIFRFSVSLHYMPDSDETAPDEDEVDGGCG